MHCHLASLKGHPGDIVPVGGLDTILEGGQVFSDLSLNSRSVALTDSSMWGKLLNLSELVSPLTNLD